MKRYSVSDGKLTLTLEEAEEGGYIVTSPSDPALITQAETLEEAFEMARDAQALLKAARRDLRRKRKPARPREAAKGRQRQRVS